MILLQGVEISGETGLQLIFALMIFTGLVAAWLGYRAVAWLLSFFDQTSNDVPTPGTTPTLSPVKHPEGGDHLAPSSTSSGNNELRVAKICAWCGQALGHAQKLPPCPDCHRYVVFFWRRGTIDWHRAGVDRPSRPSMWHEWYCLNCSDSFVSRPPEVGDPRVPATASRAELRVAESVGRISHGVCLSCDERLRAQVDELAAVQEAAKSSQEAEVVA